MAIATAFMAAPVAAAPAASGDGPASGASGRTNAPDDSDTVSEVVVPGEKAPQPGAVVGDIKPELQLGPADIQSYGDSTLTELLGDLAPETRSDRGRGGEAPVILLNGRRISSFNEIRDIPTEAILRVDILPEEVALKYGYTANQRVVNVVLRRRFQAETGELRAGGATEGGAASEQAEADLLHLRGDDRLNLDLKYQDSAALTEAQREIVSPPPSAPFALAGNVVGAAPGAEIDPALSALVGRPVTVAGVPAIASAGAPSLADFAQTAGAPNVTDVRADRTLVPATQSISANAVLAKALADRTTLTLNATLGATTSDALRGLPGLQLQIPAGDPFSPFGSATQLDRYVSSLGPLRQNIDGWTGHLGSTLNHDAGQWRLSLTDGFDHADTTTETGAGVDPSPLQALLDGLSPTFNPFGPLPASLVRALPQSRAEERTDTLNGQFLGNGPLFTLPAGQLYASVKVGDTQSWLSSASNRGGLNQGVNLARNNANAQLNVDLPLTGRANHVLGVIGDLSVNGNVAADWYSDFGTLVTLGYGLNWTPLTGVNLIVSKTRDHAAPTEQQLGDPVVLTPGAPIYDYVTGRTVNVTTITGGERSLRADTRDVTKIGLTLRPIASQQLIITANYITSRIVNAIAPLPAATAQIEAAFPANFVRGPDGELVEFDDRPVNVAREDRQELRWGVVYSRPVGPQPQPRFGRRADGGQRPPRDGAEGPGSGPGGGRGRGGFGGGGVAPGGRLELAVYHTMIFSDRMLMRPQGPMLDLLNGGAAGSSGGQPRHEIEAQAGFTLNGLGARLSADWKSGTVVRDASGAPSGTLSFSDLGTINLRLFANFAQMRSVVARWPILKGSRLTLSVTNLLDQRQRVRDATGSTPLSFQPDYLDPTGRVVALSVRKLIF